MMGSKKDTKRKRAEGAGTPRAAGTRSVLVKTAFSLFHRHGYHATGLERILRESGVSKGALYNHFASKAELGYAVVDEALSPLILDYWVGKYQESSNVIDQTVELVEVMMNDPPESFYMLGCPMGNLIQEMSAVDDEFRRRLATVANQWIGSLESSLRNGQKTKTVRQDVDVAAAAAFIVASIEGSLSLAKVNRDPAVLKAAGSQLRGYLDSLRV